MCIPPGNICIVEGSAHPSKVWVCIFQELVCTYISFWNVNTSFVHIYDMPSPYSSWPRPSCDHLLIFRMAAASWDEQQGEDRRALHIANLNLSTIHIKFNMFADILQVWMVEDTQNMSSSKFWIIYKFKSRYIFDGEPCCDIAVIPQRSIH